MIFNQETTNHNFPLGARLKMHFCNLYKLTEHRLEVLPSVFCLFEFRSGSSVSFKISLVRYHLIYLIIFHFFSFLMHFYEPRYVQLLHMTIMLISITACLWENRKGCDQRYKYTANGKRATVTDMSSITLFRVGTSSVI